MLDLRQNLLTLFTSFAVDRPGISAHTHAHVAVNTCSEKACCVV